MIAIELQGAINAIGGIETFYIADGNFVTSPIDTPANVAFDPTLNDLSVGMAVFKDSQTTGNSSNTTGEIIINNTNGQYDDWINYSFEGRSVIISMGSGRYPDDFQVIYSGLVSTISVTFLTVVVDVRDLQSTFDKPVLTNLYLGNNALPNGLEGGDDLKGKPKAKLYGSVFNYSPDLVNTAKLTYQVNDGAVLSIVAKDKGVLLTAGADYATSTLLQAASVSAGTYATCLAEGYFRLGSMPAGKVTSDVVQGATAADRSAPAILKSLALASGLTVDQINLDSFAITASINPAIVGIAITEDMTFTAAMDKIAQSIGMFYAFYNATTLIVGILTVPSGDPAITFSANEIQTGLERRAATDNSVPSYLVKVNYMQNYSPASGDLAGSVNAAQTSLLSQEYLSEQATNTDVKTQFLTASVIEVDTLLTVKSDAQAEAQRLLAIYSVKRDIFEVPLALDSLPAQPIYLMAVIALDYRRFGLSGRLFRLLGISYNMKAKQVTLTLWG